MEHPIFDSGECKLGYLSKLLCIRLDDSHYKFQIYTTVYKYEFTHIIWNKKEDDELIKLVQQGADKPHDEDQLLKIDSQEQPPQGTQRWDQLAVILDANLKEQKAGKSKAPLQAN